MIVKIIAFIFGMMYINTSLIQLEINPILWDLGGLTAYLILSSLLSVIASIIYYVNLK